jgi:hypothetical protein
MSETYYENGNIPVISTPHEIKRSKIWTLVPLDLKKSEFKIVSAINNRVLDVQNMWMANGNPVILF